MLRSDRSGFSLLEAMLTLAILGMVAASVLAAFSTNLRTAFRARAQLEAAALAETTLTRARMLTETELDRFAEREPRIFEAPFDDYRWTMSISRVDGEPRLFQATVMVSSSEASFRLVSRVRPASAVTAR